MLVASGLMRFTHTMRLAQGDTSSLRPHQLVASALMRFTHTMHVAYGADRKLVLINKQLINKEHSYLTTVT